MGQVEFVAADVGEDSLVAFVFAYKRAAEGEACFGFGPTCDDVIERDFGIEPADKSTGVPVVALLSDKSFEGDTVPGTVGDVDASDGVVESQIAVFVGAECHSVAELFVEMAGSDGESLCLVADEIIGYSLSCVLTVEAKHRGEVGFVAQSGAEVSVGVKDVGTCIAEQFLRHIA